MKQRILLSILFFVLGAGLSPAQIFNRAPLEASSWAEFPLGAIQPEGWLREQLQRQAKGLTGQLDQVYPQVMGPDNAWLGGEGDAWERGPYWLDGLLPLAYLLGDETLIAKARLWVEAILASQQENGYLGPAVDHPFVYGLQRGATHDWWPKMVAIKILRQYYMATGDKRVIDCLRRYFRYQAAELEKTPLAHWTDWGAWRGADNLDVVYWLYNLSGDPELLTLGEILHSQMVPWSDLFESGEIFSTQNSIHCVNLGQGFKAPTVWWQYSHDLRDYEAPEKARAAIRHTIGLPTGLWAGDEQLHFGSPTRGSELCTAVEMMYSLETLLRISGNPTWADWLERIAYNALPTQVSDDYMGKQYYQQVNQIACTRDWRPFSTPHDDTDLLFGTLNGYPCCLSNMHQGWPKLTQNLWYASADGGVAALVYAPSCLRTEVSGGVSLCLREETQYPFEDGIRLQFSFPGKHKKGFSCTFPLYLRVPAWSRGVEVLLNGEALDVTAENGLLCLERAWRNGDELSLRFQAELQAESWYDGALSLVRGPLLFALRMEEQWRWTDFEGRDRYYGPGAWEVTSPTPWNYCLMRDCDFAAEAEWETRPISDYPWNIDAAPLSLTVPARELPHWTVYNGSVGEIPYFTEDGNDLGSETRIRLIPYGCTTLRIAAFPSRLVPWDLSFREVY